MVETKAIDVASGVSAPEDDREAWFRTFSRVAHPRFRIVCLPHAGGAASAYRGWSRWLPQDVEVVAVSYPGRQDRLAEPCIESMDALADSVCWAAEMLDDVPVALFGHSMGASLAHEVYLRGAGGADVRALLVSGRRPPHRLVTRGVSRGGDPAIIADVTRMDPAVGELLEDDGLRELVLPAIRADYRIVDAYQPGTLPVISTPIYAYAGTEDADNLPDEMAQWAACTSAEFGLRSYEGGHFYLTGCEELLLHQITSDLKLR